MTDYTRNIVQNTETQATRTLIRGVTILSMDSDVGNLVSADILVEGSTIIEISENIEANGADIIEASGMIAMPGMVDSHRHSWEGQMRRLNSHAETLEDYSHATHFSFAKSKRFLYALSRYLFDDWR